MAFGEGYGATKHGVVGFTRALRASLQCQGSAVSASVVCPGFVSETGMFADKQREYDVKPAMFLGTTGPEKVAQTVISSIQRDRAEVIVNRGPIRLSLGMSMWFPRLGEWLGHRLGVHQTSREAADRTRKALTEG